MVKYKKKIIIFVLLAIFVIGISITSVSAAESSNGDTKAKKISQSDVLKASKNIKTYADKNKKLPNYVTIKNQKYSMEEYMHLSSLTIYYKYKQKKNTVTVKPSVKSPNSPSGSKINGKLTKKQFSTYSVNAYKYIKNYNCAPNFISTKLGKMKFQTFIYANSRILAWSADNGGKLPNTLTLSISATHPINKYFPKYSSSSSDSSSSSGSGSQVVNPTKSVSMTNIFEASNRVKNYIETNNAMPSTVKVGSDTYSANDFLYLLSKALVNKNSGINSNIPILSTNVPSNPSGNNKLGKIYKAEFFNLAKSTASYYETNKKAPNYVTSSLGNLQYQSVIYVFARIGSYIHNNKAIPNYVDVTVDSSSKINGGTGGSTNPPIGLDEYLKPTKNCQVNDARIQAKAKEITKGCTNELQKATVIFNWVRDNIRYQSYTETLKGAVNTLSSKLGNCVDQTHLLIGLLRASGIPTRYVNGMATFKSSGHIGHTWAEVYVNGKWMIADTTSSQNTLGSVKNCWNHEIWYKRAQIDF